MGEDGIRRYDIEIPRAGLGRLRCWYRTKRFLYAISTCIQFSKHPFLRNPDKGDSRLKGRAVSNGQEFRRLAAKRSPPLRALPTPRKLSPRMLLTASSQPLPRQSGFYYGQVR